MSMSPNDKIILHKIIYIKKVKKNKGHFNFLIIFLKFRVFFFRIYTAIFVILKKKEKKKR
jgi:hypothetical protein